MTHGNLTEAQRLFRNSLRIPQRLAESDPSNGGWQHDLSVSLDKLGDLARAQENLSEAQRLFGASLRIRQRLAESDPTNAAWQRGLAVSQQRLAKLARQSGNDASFKGGLLTCFQVLDRMKQRSLQFDPQMAQLYQQLSAMFRQRLEEIACGACVPQFN